MVSRHDLFLDDLVATKVALITRRALLDSLMPPSRPFLSLRTQHIGDLGVDVASSPESEEGSMASPGGNRCRYGMGSSKGSPTSSEGQGDWNMDVPPSPEVQDGDSDVSSPRNLRRYGMGDLTEDEEDASMAVALFPTVQGQGTEPLLPQLEVTPEMGEPLPQ